MSCLIQRFAANSTGRDFVVGDIHGCFSLFEKALAQIGFEPACDRMFCVGDLIDRGPESERALEFLAADWFVSVRGNHEQMCLAAMTDGPNQAQDRQLWSMNGGGWFDEIASTDQDRFAAAFAALPYLVEIETTESERVGIVHADVIDDDWAATSERVAREPGPATLSELVWSRDRVALLSSAGQQDVGETVGVSGIDTVYFGHTPLHRPIASANTRWLDTGAVFENTLSVAEAGRHGDVWSVDAATAGITEGWEIR